MTRCWSNIFAAIVAIAVAATIVACAQPQTVEHNGELLSLTDSLLKAGATDTLRLGRLHSGEMAVKTITLRNDTDKPFVILRHETTCHCTSMQYDKRPVKPGEEIDIECTFDSRGEYGWQMKLVNFHISGSEHPFRLFVEADIE